MYSRQQLTAHLYEAAAVGIARGCGNVRSRVAGRSLGSELLELNPRMSMSSSASAPENAQHASGNNHQISRLLHVTDCSPNERSELSGGADWARGVSPMLLSSLLSSPIDGLCSTPWGD